MKETNTRPIDARPLRLFFRLPFDRINRIAGSFLFGTQVLALNVVPFRVWSQRDSFPCAV